MEPPEKKISITPLLTYVFEYCYIFISILLSDFKSWVVQLLLKKIDPSLWQITLTKHSTHAKTNHFDNSNSKQKLHKIQNVTVIENPKLESKEDVAEDTTKAIEEAYEFSCYFGK